MSKLKEKRKAAGIRQQDLADVTGVNVRMIGHYEQGVKDINKASALTIYKFAKALGCTMEDLLKIEE